MDFPGGKIVLCGLLAGLMQASQSAAAPSEAWREVQDQIADAWRVRAEVLSIGHDVMDKKDLERIGELRSEYGLTSLPTVSLALLKEIQEHPGDSFDLQHERLEYARKFSPHFPATEYFFCGFRQSFVSAPDALQFCLSGLAHNLSATGGRFNFLTNAFLLGARTYFLFFGFFLVFLWLKYRSTVSHLWAHGFRSLSPLGVSFFGGVFLVLSWLWIGWLGPVLTLLLILWRYLPRAEKALFSLLLIPAALLPFAFLAPALHLNYERSPVPILENPLRGTALPERAQALERWVKDHPSDSDALFTLALIEKKVGLYLQARGLLEEAQRLNPAWTKPAINLANIDYAEGKTASALARLQNVVAASPQANVALFNLGKILYRENRLEEGNLAHQKAKDINGERFVAMDKASAFRDPRRFLIDETLASQDLAPRVWSISPDVIAIRDRYLKAWAPMLPVPALWIVIGCVYLLALLSAQVWRVPRQPRSCEKCGLPSCDICDPLVQHESLCSQCYHMFVRLEAIESEARKQKDVEIRRHRIFRETRERWLTLFVPGMNQFFRSRPGLASIIMVPAIASALLFVPNSWFLTGPESAPGLPTFPYRLAAIVVFNVTYLLSLFAAVRR
ncbi:MAG: hypothetical protein V1798_04745 [Pseudomonadota bacterium]